MIFNANVTGNVLVNNSFSMVPVIPENHGLQVTEQPELRNGVGGDEFNYVPDYEACDCVPEDCYCGGYFKEPLSVRMEQKRKAQKVVKKLNKPDSVCSSRKGSINCRTHPFMIIFDFKIISLF